MVHPGQPSSDNGHRPWSKQRRRLVWISNGPASCGQLLHDEFLNIQAVVASPLRRAGRHHRHVHIAVELEQQARRLRNILARQLHCFATDVQSWNVFTVGAEKADILLYFHMYQQIGMGIHDVPFKMEWPGKAPIKNISVVPGPGFSSLARLIGRRHLQRQQYEKDHAAKRPFRFPAASCYPAEDRYEIISMTSAP